MWATEAEVVGHPVDDEIGLMFRGESGESIQVSLPQSVLLQLVADGATLLRMYEAKGRFARGALPADAVQSFRAEPSAGKTGSVELQLRCQLAGHLVAGLSAGSARSLAALLNSAAERSEEGGPAIPN
jgi:hypothetical protein